MRFFLFIAGASATLHDASATLHGRRTLGWSEQAATNGLGRPLRQKEADLQVLKFEGSYCEVVESDVDGKWVNKRCKCTDSVTGKITAKLSFVQVFSPDALDLAGPIHPVEDHSSPDLGGDHADLLDHDEVGGGSADLKSSIKDHADLLVFDDCYCASVERTDALDRGRCDCIDDYKGHTWQYAYLKFTDYRKTPSQFTVDKIEKKLKERTNRQVTKKKKNETKQRRADRRWSKRLQMLDQSGGPDQVQ